MERIISVQLLDPTVDDLKKLDAFIRGKDLNYEQIDKTFYISCTNRFRDDLVTFLTNLKTNYFLFFVNEKVGTATSVYGIQEEKVKRLNSIILTKVK